MSTSEKYPAWLVAIVSVVLLATTGAIGTWVGTTLAAHGDQLNVHGERLASHEVRIANGERAAERIDQKLDKILDELRKP